MRGLTVKVQSIIPPTSAADPDPNPDPDPPDPYVFGPPGSGSKSISQRYGSIQILLSLGTQTKKKLFYL